MIKLTLLDVYLQKMFKRKKGYESWEYARRLYRKKRNKFILKIPFYVVHTQLL